MKPPRIEDVAEPVIGRIYNVPAIEWGGGVQGKEAKPYWSSPTLPILGGLHNDREVIGFEDDHWHVDWRFVGAHAHALAGSFISRHAKVIKGFLTTGVIHRVHRRCKRPHEIFKFRPSTWMPELEKHYKDAVLPKCLKCPHRGISLVGAPIENGARVCPGHGLAWNIETGKLQPRL